MKPTGRIRVALLTFIAAALCISLSACDLFGPTMDSIEQAFRGVPATLSTYDDQGHQIDEVKGSSLRAVRDDTFDTTDSEGNSNKDSDVLKISLGQGNMNHVGSTLIVAQDGLKDISAMLPGNKLLIENTDPGAPFINDLFYKFRNAWGGLSRTILIRSQQGAPIAVFAGNDVQTLAPDIPNATWFRIDGKYLLVYRADYTVYDNSLLGNPAS